MSIELGHVADMVWGQPWAIRPDKLRDIGAALEQRLAGEIRETINRGAAVEVVAEEERYRVVDGWAVIAVHGTISKRANLIQRASGGVSTDALRGQLQRAADDPQVRGIVLDIDSPGGSVWGTFEAAELLYSLRGRKPSIAVANEMACSAAYLIGAAAGKFVGPSTAVAGSIGVIIAHRDESARMEKAGVKTTLITAGRFKAAGHSAVPLTADGRDSLQALADHYYGLFVAAVSKYRGVAMERVLAEMADGREWVGEAAVRAGLLDGVDTLAGVLGRGVNMTVTELRAQYAAAVGEIEATAQAQGRAAVEAEFNERVRALEASTGQVVTAERRRCAGITAAFAGDTVAAVSAIEAGQSVEAAKAARYDQVAAELQRLQAARAEMAAAVTPLVASSVGLPPFAPNAQAPRPKVAADANGEIPEATLRAAWDADASVQSEFGRFEAFAAYSRANAKGLVKIYGKKTG